jgi:hypothetical protein
MPKAIGSLLATVLAVSSCIPRAPRPSADRSEIGASGLSVGEQQTLLESGALGLTYFPDMGTSLIQRQPTTRLILTARDTTYLVEGVDLRHLTTAKAVLRPGSPGSFDNGYAGVSAVLEIDRVLYGFYHAEDHEGLPPIPGGIPGYFASIALATSSDSGKTWTKRGPTASSGRSSSH